MNPTTGQRRAKANTGRTILTGQQPGSKSSVGVLLLLIFRVASMDENKTQLSKDYHDSYSNIASTPRCRGGGNSFLWIAPLYSRHVPYSKHVLYSRHVPYSRHVLYSRHVPPLYSRHVPCVLSKEVSSTIFKVFGMTRPGIEPRSLGQLANTKSPIQIATLNVRTLSRIDQLPEQTASVTDHNIDKICLQEHRYLYNEDIKYHDTGNGWTFVSASARKNPVNPVIGRCRYIYRFAGPKIT